MNVNQFLALMVAANIILLLFYFGYQMQDTEVTLQSTKQAILNKYRQTNHSIIESSDDEEYYYEHDELEYSLDEFYNKKYNIEIIGDDTQDKYDVFIHEQLKLLQIAPLIIIEQTDIRQQQSLNLKKDNNFCLLNNIYILQQKQIPLNILNDFNVKSSAAKVITKIGKDALPEIETSKSLKYNIPTETTIYFMSSLNFHKYFHNRRISNMLTIKQYQIPHIETIILQNEEQCKTALSQPLIEYQILGFFHNITLIDNNIQERLIRKYQNGTLCGIIKDDILIQKQFNKTSISSAIVHIISVEPFNYTIYDSLEIIYENNTKVNSTEYGLDMKNEIHQIIDKVLKNALQYLSKDVRFFYILRFQFAMIANELKLLGIYSKFYGEPKELVQQIIEESLIIQNKLQNEYVKKYRNQIWDS
ncbi:hypothetical protein pb186bvf_011310 [Paramecium bursaria]